MSRNPPILSMGFATRRNQFKFNRLVLGACLVLFLQRNALAASITGDIYFDGKAKFDTRSLATASQVNRWKNVQVGSDTGDFATFASPENPVVMASPWVFASSAPFSGLWSVGGFTFDLTLSVVAFRSRNFLDLQGVGTVSGHGFDVTSGDWSVTFTKHRRGRLFWFSFEADPPVAQPPAASVPESGSTGALLALGLIGLYFHLKKGVIQTN
jgi:hypothetical protein